MDETTNETGAVPPVGPHPDADDAPVQRRYNELRADEDELHRLLGMGADKAREASAPTLAAMYERMGFTR